MSTKASRQMRKEADSKRSFAAGWRRVAARGDSRGFRGQANMARSRAAELENEASRLDRMADRER